MPSKLSVHSAFLASDEDYNVALYANSRSVLSYARRTSSSYIYTLADTLWTRQPIANCSKCFLSNDGSKMSEYIVHHPRCGGTLRIP